MNEEELHQRIAQLERENAELRGGAVAVIAARCAAHVQASWRLTETVQAADKGDTAAAREVIRFIVGLLENAQVQPHFAANNLAPFPAAARDYLLNAMREISTGTEPKEALGLKSPHRSRTWGPHQERFVANMVWLQVRNGNGGKGMSPTAAAKAVTKSLKTLFMRSIEPYRSLRASDWKSVKATYEKYGTEIDKKHGITRRRVR